MNRSGKGFLLFLLSIFLYLVYLIETAPPDFDLQHLESYVHEEVKKADEIENELKETLTKHELVELARKFFSPKLFDAGTITDETLLTTYFVELKINKVYERLCHEYRHIANPKSLFAWNNVGGVFARQRIVFVTPNSYMCIWGSTQEQSGFSGYYPCLDEGDVMICGTLESTDPEQALCVPRTYTFDSTSHLRSKTSRYYTMSKNCWMCSYGTGNICATMWQGIVSPFLFFNNDSKSLRIQLGDAYVSICKWLKWRIFLNNTKK